MSGIETFPALSEEQPWIVSEQQLMGAFQEHIRSGLPLAGALESSRRAERERDFYHCDYYNEQLEGVTLEQFHQRLGELTDTTITRQEHYEDLRREEVFAEEHLRRVGRLIKRRPIRVTNLFPDKKLHPIKLYGNPRFGHYEEQELLGYGLEVEGLVRGIGEAALDTFRLDIKPTKPKRIGMRRVQYCTVNMVSARGEPLVDVEFLD